MNHLVLYAYAVTTVSVCYLPNQQTFTSRDLRPPADASRGRSRRKAHATLPCDRGAARAHRRRARGAAA